MVQVQLPNSVKRILNICLILIIIGTFAIIVLGTATVKVQTDNKITIKFLEIAKNTEVNFEDSLLVYTEKTRSIIGFLSELRPSNEKEVIDFISQIEKIGQDLGLDISLQTYKDTTDKSSKKESAQKDTIIYRVEFFGSNTDLTSFLSKLEALPYFVKVSNIDFKDLNYIEKTEDTPPNINLTIDLYTRDDTTQKS